jgi:N-acetylmuramoyl-L-alanine amidase
MKARLLILAATLQSCSPCPAGVVADTLFCEARGEGRRGLEAVASVIFNRSQKRGYSLERTVLARKQFSCWNEGYTKPTPRNELERDILAFCEGIEEQMEGGTFRPTTKADHYLRFDCFPSWRKDLRNQERIGAHLFGNCK